MREVRGDLEGGVTMTRLRVASRAAIEFIDITEMVADAAQATGVSEGAVLVRTRHTTTAVVCTEGDPNLHRDCLAMLQRLVPDTGSYRHIEEGVANVRAHLTGAPLRRVDVGAPPGRPARPGHLAAALLAGAVRSPHPGGGRRRRLRPNPATRS